MSTARILLLLAIVLPLGVFSGALLAQNIPEGPSDAPPGGTRHSNRLLFDELSDRREAIRATEPPEEKAALQRQLQRWQNEQERDAILRSLHRHFYSLSEQESDWLWFWTNHFSIFSKKGATRLLLSDYENEAIKRHLDGNFTTLLRSAVLHPAMLIYLDNAQNRKGRHNENLAREILELHTVGINGGYTQADIQTLAQALSGITLWNQLPKNTTECSPPDCATLTSSGTILLRKQHAGGAKSFMGKTYADEDGLAALQILDDLSRHPKTIERMALRLLQYKVQDVPSPEQMKTVIDAWTGSGGELTQVLQAVEALARKNQPSAITEPQTGTHARIKDPFRHLRTAARLLASHCNEGLNLDIAFFRQALDRLGMGLYQRISPDGYPLSADYWNSGDTLIQRLDMAETLVKQISRNGRLNPRIVQSCATRLRQTASPQTRKALEALQGEPLQWIAVYLISPNIMFH